ncbi:MAG: hypothetical protein SPF17_10465, partial [Candidatus Mucispirillum faecigallinarum]|nr:hypothetical protein [Candidatus Mucispirillum faecigallinarum]
MKNIFKIIFILCLGIFVVTGCADNSSGNGGGNTENTGGDNNGNGGNTGNGGDNNGDGDNTGEVYTPEFTKLISLGGLSYGETADGKRYVWGNAGELAGAGNKDEVTTPVEVDLTITDNITKINNNSLNGATYYIITDKGLYVWGYNRYGQAGNGESGYEKDEDGNDDFYNPKRVLTPHKVQGIDGSIKKIIPGNTVYALTENGLYAWGHNEAGQVGNGSACIALPPYKVKDITGNIKEVIPGSTVYVLTDTGLYAWGDNGNGEVGNGDGGYEKGEDGNDDYSKPKQVLTPYKVEGITGNIKEVIPGNTVYALTENGLYAWG